MVHLLMRIFDRWERFDGELRLKISNGALNTLQHISSISKLINRYLKEAQFYYSVILEVGRRAIKANNGLQLLYRFCVGCPEEKVYDCLLSRVCAIINSCLERSELSVPEYSPAKFRLPQGTLFREGSVESNSDIEGPVCNKLHWRISQLMTKKILFDRRTAESQPVDRTVI